MRVQRQAAAPAADVATATHATKAARTKDMPSCRRRRRRTLVNRLNIGLMLALKTKQWSSWDELLEAKLDWLGPPHVDIKKEEVDEEEHSDEPCSSSSVRHNLRRRSEDVKTDYQESSEEDDLLSLETKELFECITDDQRITTKMRRGVMDIGPTMPKLRSHLFTPCCFDRVGLVLCSCGLAVKREAYCMHCRLQHPIRGPVVNQDWKVLPVTSGDGGTKIRLARNTNGNSDSDATPTPPSSQPSTITKESRTPPEASPPVPVSKPVKILTPSPSSSSRSSRAPSLDCKPVEKELFNLPAQPSTASSSTPMLSPRDRRAALREEIRLQHPVTVRAKSMIRSRAPHTPPPLPGPSPVPLDKDPSPEPPPRPRMIPPTIDLVTLSPSPPPESATVSPSATVSYHHTSTNAHLPPLNHERYTDSRTIHHRQLPSPGIANHHRSMPIERSISIDNRSIPTHTRQAPTVGSQFYARKQHSPLDNNNIHRGIQNQHHHVQQQHHLQNQHAPQQQRAGHPAHLGQPGHSSEHPGYTGGHTRHPGHTGYATEHPGYAGSHTRPPGHSGGHPIRHAGPSGRQAQQQQPMVIHSSQVHIRHSPLPSGSSSAPSHSAHAGGSQSQRTSPSGGGAGSAQSQQGGSGQQQRQQPTIVIVLPPRHSRGGPGQQFVLPPGTTFRTVNAPPPPSAIPAHLPPPSSSHLPPPSTYSTPSAYSTPPNYSAPAASYSSSSSSGGSYHQHLQQTQHIQQQQSSHHQMNQQQFAYHHNNHHVQQNSYSTVPTQHTAMPVLRAELFGKNSSPSNLVSSTVDSPSSIPSSSSALYDVLHSDESREASRQGIEEPDDEDDDMPVLECHSTFDEGQQQPQQVQHIHNSKDCLEEDDEELEDGELVDDMDTLDPCDSSTGEFSAIPSSSGILHR